VTAQEAAAPPTLDDIVPSIHFEGRVNLLRSLVAPKAAQHRNAMQNKKPVQEVFEEIPSLLSILFDSVSFELR
jgi:hypothetical protein